MRIDLQSIVMIDGVYNTHKDIKTTLKAFAELGVFDSYFGIDVDRLLLEAILEVEKLYDEFPAEDRADLGESFNTLKSKYLDIIEKNKSRFIKEINELN